MLPGGGVQAYPGLLSAPTAPYASQPTPHLHILEVHIGPASGGLGGQVSHPVSVQSASVQRTYIGLPAPSECTQLNSTADFGTSACYLRRTDSIKKEGTHAANHSLISRDIPPLHEPELLHDEQQ